MHQRGGAAGGRPPFCGGHGSAWRLRLPGPDGGREDHLHRRGLGCREEAASPTFSIVNEYLDADGLPVYHFDFYRLESPQEALDIGVEDYFYSGRPCFIEWPERIGQLLPPDAVEVTIEEMPGGSRRITLP